MCLRLGDYRLVLEGGYSRILLLYLLCTVLFATRRIESSEEHSKLIRDFEDSEKIQKDKKNEQLKKELELQYRKPWDFFWTRMVQCVLKSFDKNVFPPYLVDRPVLNQVPFCSDLNNFNLSIKNFILSLAKNKQYEFVMQQFELAHSAVFQAVLSGNLICSQ